jgi:hypothetical protein
MELEIASPGFRRIMLARWQSGQFRRDVDMTDLRHSFRLTWLAVAAFVGMLSVVGDASGSTVSSAPRNRVRHCCLKRDCTVCCCTPASASSGPFTTGRSAALLSGRIAFSTPAGPCECRSSEPGAPASRQESRSSLDRAGQGHGASIHLNVHAPAAVAIARHILPAASPPRSPLYLRTSRLLI